MASLRHGVDDFAGARVVQFLPGLMLYGVRIALKALDVAFQVAVLLLQLMPLPCEALRFLALLLVGRQSILTKDDMESEREREHGRCSRYHLSPAHLSAVVPAGHRRTARFRYASLGGMSHLYEYKFQPIPRQVENSNRHVMYLDRTEASFKLEDACRKAANLPHEAVPA